MSIDPAVVIILLTLLLCVAIIVMLIIDNFGKKKSDKPAEPTKPIGPESFRKKCPCECQK